MGDARRSRRRSATTSASLPWPALEPTGQAGHLQRRLVARWSTRRPSDSTPPRSSSSGCGSSKTEPAGLQPLLRLPHPAAQALAAKAAKLQSRPGRRGGEASQREQHAREPGLDAGDAHRRTPTRPPRSSRRAPTPRPSCAAAANGRRRARALVRLTMRSRPCADAGSAGGRRRTRRRGRWPGDDRRLLGLRRAVRWSACSSSSTSRSLELSAQLLSTRATPSRPPSSSGSQTTPTCSATGPFLEPGHVHVFAAFIVPLTFALSLGLALLVNRSGSCRRSSARCSSCRPRARTSSPRWSGRCRSSTASASGWPTRCSSGSARTDRLALRRRPAVVLAGAGDGAAVAAGRLLHDPVPRRPAADPEHLYEAAWVDGAARLADVPLHHAAAAAQHVGRGAAAASSRRSRRSTSSTTCSGNRSLRAAAAGLPLLHRAGAARTTAAAAPAR